MAGLGAEAVPGQPQQPPPAQALPDQAQGEAPPEEQAIYDNFVSLALTMIYDKDMLQKTLAMIQKAPDPVQGLAHVASSVAMKVYQNAQENGVDIPGDMLLQAGANIIEAIVEISEAKGLGPFTEEQMEQALLQAADIFAAQVEQAGGYGPEVKQQDMAALQQMKASGQLPIGQPPAAPAQGMM